MVNRKIAEKGFTYDLPNKAGCYYLIRPKEKGECAIIEFVMTEKGLCERFEGFNVMEYEGYQFSGPNKYLNRVIISPQLS